METRTRHTSSSRSKRALDQPSGQMNALEQYREEKLMHYEGEFSITYSYGYRSGYNLGFYCAESVNFATEHWLKFDRIARKCNREKDRAWVDVGEMERKSYGEPTPEYYEETDDDDDDLSDEVSKLPPPDQRTGYLVRVVKLLIGSEVRVRS